MTALSLRGRLTLWYTLALVVVLGLFAADVLWVLTGIGLRRVDRELASLLTPRGWSRTRCRSWGAWTGRRKRATR